MKQYLDLLQDIIDNGASLEDRTGTGRRKVFGRQLRFDLSKGEFPLVTTRKVNMNAIIHEMLWFIKGSTSSTELVQMGAKIWEGWAVKDKHIDEFVKKTFPDNTEEELKYVREQIKNNFEGSIGKLYGLAWRNAPAPQFCPMNPVRPLDEIASDKLEDYRKDYDSQPPQDINGKTISFEDYASWRSYQTIDQLQEIIVSLKKRPFSSRHVLSAWVPEFIPFETMSPQENVLINRGALAPCHVMQQYLVLPPKEEGGKKRLSMMMCQR